jgi:hypothetical protein
MPTISTDLFFWRWQCVGIPRALDYGGASIAEALVLLGSYDRDGVIDLTGWLLMIMKRYQLFFCFCFAFVLLLFCFCFAFRQLGLLLLWEWTSYGLDRQHCTQINDVSETEVILRVIRLYFIPSTS